jgi:hypothetical protein
MDSVMPVCVVAKRSVAHCGLNVEETLYSGASPTPLLLFAEAPVPELIHSRLQRCARNTPPVSKGPRVSTYSSLVCVEI